MDIWLGGQIDTPCKLVVDSLCFRLSPLTVCIITHLIAGMTFFNLQNHKMALVVVHK